MGILNNREIAIFVWLLIFLIYAFFLNLKEKEVKGAFKNILSTFFVKQIIIVVILMMGYVFMEVYCLAKVNLWNNEQLKNTVFWGASFAFYSLLSIEKIERDKTFFKNSIIGSFKLTAILCFIFNLYPFPLLVELIFVPILMFIGFSSPYYDNNKEYYRVKIFLERFLSFLGIGLIGYTLYMLISNFDEFVIEKILYDFFTPALLTFFYLPFLFGIVVYCKYDYVFTKINCCIRNKKLHKKAKIYTIIKFNLRLNLIERWSRQIPKLEIGSKEDLADSFNYIFRARSAEKNPKFVPTEIGWCPYKAKKFLVNQGLATGFYDKVFKEEWEAVSPIFEFSNSIILNNITYNVKGTKDVAKELKLKVNVNNATKAEMKPNRNIAQQKLLTIADSLSLASLNQHLSNKMKNAIIQRKSYSEVSGNNQLSLVLKNHSIEKFKWYSFFFTIAKI